ncbi:MAG: helix-turn-helix transcriptional regulator [Deltaproteobacteria bacterium]|nr:helix-turn-helix transcriptional regulator [Deltaproteobacteria bacterium]
MRSAAPERVLRTLGRRIAELRRDLGLTQEQLAETLGVSVRYVQYVEAGEENLTVQTLVRIANNLRVPVADLFAQPTGPKAGPGRPKKSA